MRKLLRGAAPSCLANYTYPPDKKWDDVTDPDKNLIWIEINKMQQFRCAYCERTILYHDPSGGKRHIEHFIERSCDKSQTFDWDNLFGSCSTNNTCGHHKGQWKTIKENQGLNGCDELKNAAIIKPDTDNPEKFLIFSADGGVHPIEGLKTSKPSDYERAQKTIEIFNLYSDGIVGERHSVIGSRKTKIEEGKEKEYDSGYMDAIEVLCNTPEEKLDLTREYMKTEVEIAKKRLPFATAIKHVLTNQSA